MKKNFRFWVAIFIIWIIATAIDRFCWENLSGVPAWDQADYLNSALNHGQAIGLIDGGKWEGLNKLLDLSPKIPPLASLVNGSVIALAGDSPAQAAWSLSLWNGLLLFSIAKWGVSLNSKYFAILSTCFVAISPALAQLRVDYVLEMPLTACISLSIWMTGVWLDPIKGGKWWQALLAALSTTCSLLIKQSSLLIIFPAFIFSAIICIKQKTKRLYQLIIGFIIICIGILPWLKHNWITFIGGTNRAVIESAALEGDPNLLSIKNWVWYPRVIPNQVGTTIFLIGLSGIILCIILLLNKKAKYFNSESSRDNIFLWKWLIINFLSGWILTTLIPNKDERYITPLLPFLIIILSRGWWQWNLLLKRKIGFIDRNIDNLFLSLVISLIGTLPQTLKTQFSFIKSSPKGPIEEIVKKAGGANPKEKRKTVIVVPSTPDLNQHNISYFGKRNGGNLIGRQLGSNKRDIMPVLNQAEWIILAEGNQGSIRDSARLLDQAIRQSDFFSEVQRYKRIEGGSYSLWRRKESAPKPINFSKIFPQLAKKLSLGPKGLSYIFKEIEIQHMLDGHFQYKVPVRNMALKKLEKNPNDIDAKWTLTLLSLLANRPEEASIQLKQLQSLIPDNSWPSAYLIIVELSKWNPWSANSIATYSQKNNENNVIEGLGDLSAIIAGKIWRIPSAKISIRKALIEIESHFNEQE